MAAKAKPKTVRSEKVSERMVPVSTLVPKDCFELKGNQFTFDGIEGDRAKVILMETATIKVATNKTKEISYGVARLEISRDTKVKKI